MITPCDERRPLRTAADVAGGVLVFGVLGLFVLAIGLQQAAGWMRQWIVSRSTDTGRNELSFIKANRISPGRR